AGTADSDRRAPATTGAGEREGRVQATERHHGDASGDKSAGNQGRGAQESRGGVYPGLERLGVGSGPRGLRDGFGLLQDAQATIGITPTVRLPRIPECV